MKIENKAVHSRQVPPIVISTEKHLTHSNRQEPWQRHVLCTLNTTSQVMQIPPAKKNPKYW